MVQRTNYGLVLLCLRMQSCPVLTALLTPVSSMMSCVSKSFLGQLSVDGSVYCRANVGVVNAQGFV